MGLPRRGPNAAEGVEFSGDQPKASGISRQPPRLESAQADPRRSILRNGSPLNCPLPQALEARQHGEHALELAVEMDLIAPELFQVVGVEGLTERLFVDERPVRQFLLPGLELRQDLGFQNAAQATGVGGGGRLLRLQFAGIARQHIRPPLRHILTEQRRPRGLVGIVALGAEQVEGAVGAMS